MKIFDDTKFQSKFCFEKKFRPEVKLFVAAAESENDDENVSLVRSALSDSSLLLISVFSGLLLRTAGGLSNGTAVKIREVRRFFTNIFIGLLFYSASCNIVILI